MDKIKKVVAGIKRDVKQLITSKKEKKMTMKELCSNGNRFDFSKIDLD